MSLRKYSSFAIGALLGSLIGASMAILFAPQSGISMRTQIQQRVQSIRNEVTSAAQQRRIQLESELTRLRQPYISK